MHQIILTRPLDRANKLEGILLDHPGLRWHTLNNNLAEGKQTMVMRFQGPTSAIAALKRRYVEAPPPHIAAVEVLYETPRSLVLFAVEESGVNPMDISGLVQTELGPATVVRVHKSIEGARWQILTLRTERVRGFLERVKELGLQVEDELDRPVPRYELAGYLLARGSGGDEGLTPAERSVLDAAIREGFYEQPKRTSIAALSKRLQMPRSTVHYHLQRAEAKVMPLVEELLL